MQEICTASQTERQEKMEKLSNPQKTIEVIKKYDFAFQKKFGQNFLIDAHVLTRSLLQQISQRMTVYWKSDLVSER